MTERLALARLLTRNTLLDMTKTGACAFVNSRLCQLCSLRYISESNIAKLQRAQNALARIVSLTRRTDHIRPVLVQTLHWLPIKYRISFKVHGNTGKPAVRRTQHNRLSISYRHVSCTRQVSSQSIKTEFAPRAFSQAALHFVIIHHSISATQRHSIISGLTNLHVDNHN